MYMCSVCVCVCVCVCSILIVSLFRLVYKSLERVVEDTRKTVGEDVKLLEEEEEEEEKESVGEEEEEEEEDAGNQSTSELPNVMKQLTVRSVEKLNQQLKVSRKGTHTVHVRTVYIRTYKFIWEILKISSMPYVD